MFKAGDEVQITCALAAHNGGRAIDMAEHGIVLRAVGDGAAWYVVRFGLTQVRVHGGNLIPLCPMCQDPTTSGGALCANCEKFYTAVHRG